MESIHCNWITFVGFSSPISRLIILFWILMFILFWIRGFSFLFHFEFVYFLTPFEMLKYISHVLMYFKLGYDNNFLMKKKKSYNHSLTLVTVLVFWSYFEDSTYLTVVGLPCLSLYYWYTRPRDGEMSCVRGEAVNECVRDKGKQTISFSL